MFFGSFLGKKFWSVLFDPVRFLGEKQQKHQRNVGWKKETQTSNKKGGEYKQCNCGETREQLFGAYCVVRFVVGKFRKQKKGTNGTPKKRDGVALCKLFAQSCTNAGPDGSHIGNKG